jgi:hypothetical protein
MAVGIPFKKGNKGRPKGAVNKTTLAAKEAFQLAFDELGGWQGLAQWAKSDPDNRKVFYSLYSKLIPMDLTSNGNTVIAPQIIIPPPEQ